MQGPWIRRRGVAPHLAEPITHSFCQSGLLSVKPKADLFTVERTTWIMAVYL